MSEYVEDPFGDQDATTNRDSNSAPDSPPLLPGNPPAPIVPDEAPPPPPAPPLPPSAPSTTQEQVQEQTQDQTQDQTKEPAMTLSDILGPAPPAEELENIGLQNITLSDGPKEAVFQKRARRRGVHGLVNTVMGFPWTLRRIVLNSDDKFLYYYNGDEFRDKIDLRGLYAREVSALEADGRMNAFCLYDADNSPVLLLAANEAAQTADWINALNVIARMY